VPPLTRPLRTLSIVGSEGLPGFATMVLAILVLDLVPSIPRSDPVNLAVMVLCGCAEYLALRRHGGKGGGSVALIEPSAIDLMEPTCHHSADRMTRDDAG
jgi:hypothetical protein